METNKPTVAKTILRIFLSTNICIKINFRDLLWENPSNVLPDNVELEIDYRVERNLRKVSMFECVGNDGYAE